MLKEFKNNKILLAYYGGSTAYGTRISLSDKDIIVVLDGLNGTQHVSNSEQGIEYYVFGKDYFMQKMEFDDEVTPYLKLFNDDLLASHEPIIIDESFREVYEKYLQRDFSDYIVKYLDAVIDYYSVFLSGDSLKKNMYHLYRIEEQVKRYLETGEFKIGISEEVLEKIIVFKENYKTDNSDVVSELRGILNYLKGVWEDVIN